MRKIGYGILVLAIGVLAGCASTEVTAVRNPKYDALLIKKIAVVARFQDLKTRQTFETDFANRLGDAGFVGVPSMNIIPPLREYSDDEIRTAFADNRVDAVFLVIVTDVSKPRDLRTPIHHYHGLSIGLWQHGVRKLQNHHLGRLLHLQARGCGLRSMPSSQVQVTSCGGLLPIQEATPTQPSIRSPTLFRQK